MAYPLQDYQFVPTVLTQDAMETDIELSLSEDVHMATSAIVVSDGSLDPTTGKAAFAWIMATNELKAWVH